MIKTFKHPKLRIESISDLNQDLKKYCVRFSDIDHGNWFTEQELLDLGFEEVKNNHFGNGMIDGGEGCYVNTTKQIKSVYRYEDIDGDVMSECIDWSIFQTEEQAKQFDKMMMTVWKIWKWKKENDDTEGGEYSLYYNRQKKKFGWADYSIEYEYGFFLPRFSSSNDVHRLISDLGEELNNLLCWIK